MINSIDMDGAFIIQRWDRSEKEYDDYQETINEITNEIKKLNKKRGEQSLIKWVAVFVIKIAAIFFVLMVCGQEFRGIDSLAPIVFAVSVLFAYQSQKNKFINDTLAITEATVIWQGVAQKITSEYLAKINKEV
ncbi:hypothetical protein CCAL9344_08055 [Campylobacter sp. RM9344]|uniref:SMODS and SLOG-associating 2TM effector domain-containing protein n=1 Tax=Campylobacter californiensis TaxID=1032243 RepID=A0AAW3ZU75_9BACT|nr:hypothetical protein [Campylobacter sp. RM9344]MBE3608750.1 hypothetical protein [Campylobacter sp. RM9337]